MRLEFSAALSRPEKIGFVHSRSRKMVPISICPTTQAALADAEAFKLLPERRQTALVMRFGEKRVRRGAATHEGVDPHRLSIVFACGLLEATYPLAEQVLHRTIELVSKAWTSFLVDGFGDASNNFRFA
jgi:hypothetical protein